MLNTTMGNPAAIFPSVVLASHLGTIAQIPMWQKFSHDQETAGTLQRFLE